MLQFEKPGELRNYIRERKQKALSIGFVPTMGALHEGHLSMVRRAKKENGLTVASIFVNPIQFNNPADLEKYPRNLERDIGMLLCEGCDVLFSPGVSDMYPEGEVQQEIDLGGLDRVMEGRFRPGHFRGVAIVVRKLFEMIGPDNAYFGKKDFQQMKIIMQMVRTLSIPVTIVPCETIREQDGLAMSSRNMRLTAEGRAVAPAIHQTLLWARGKAGSIPPEDLSRQAFDRLSALPGFRVEYFEIVDPETLLPIPTWLKGRPAVACTAAYVGDIRLIDNMELFS